MIGFIEQQKMANADTRDKYEVYKHHRDKSTNLILSLQKGGKILIIGAGNCNDVDLVTFTQNFSEVHLLDIDEEALNFGIKHQLGSQTHNVSLHITDVTQIADSYNKLLKNPFHSTANRNINALRNLSFPSVPSLKEAFNIVVSQCIISQIVEPAVRLWTKEKDLKKAKLFKTLAGELVVAHLKEMAAYLSKGSTGVVITDVVSSEAVGNFSEHTIQDILYNCYYNSTSLIYGKNLFGTNIVNIFHSYKKDLSTIIQLEVANPQNAPAWIWEMSKTKQYIVQGFIFQKL